MIDALGAMAGRPPEATLFPDTFLSTLSNLVVRVAGAEAR